jgi:predicted ATPase/class 3 adenylate cyclase
VRELPTGTVTFLFSDIEGSTRLLEATGPGFGALLARHQAILRSCWREHDGVEVSTDGDAFFVVFEDAVEAVAAAACVQRQLAAEAWPAGNSVRVRIGIHTGRGARGGDNYIGMDVHRAARIATAGHGGQVLLSDATRRLVERDLPEGVSLRDLGAHRLRDLSEPERISQLVVPGLIDQFPAIRSLDARPTNLPAAAARLLGRDRDVERIRGLLEQYRLVTLTGPGGVGKTRLALAVAESMRDRFPDGVFVSWLAPVTDPARLPSAIGGPIGVQESGDRPARDVLLEQVREQDMLLVLDNFEHLGEQAGYLSELLQAAPGLRLIVTSQTVLRLAVEQVHDVLPLPVPGPSSSRDAVLESPAVALFEERVRAIRPDFRLRAEDVTTVADIVARLDGLPLAIELAAARMRVLAPKQILARLDQRLALLTGGGADRPARHQTLRAALDWSYELLGGPSRELLARLSIYRGGFDFPAVEAIAAIEPRLDPIDELGLLAEHSLVRRDDVGGEPRFTMLEAIREYAGERLSESARSETIAAAHARTFQELARDLGPVVTQTDGFDDLERLEREHDNMRAALRWTLDSGSRDAALEMIAALWRYWHLRGHIVEGRLWAAEALRSDAAASPAAISRAMVADGSLAYWQADYPTATARYVDALAQARLADDDAMIADALFNLSMMLTSGGRTDEATELLAEAERRSDASDEPGRGGRLAFARGYAAALSGRLDEATGLAEQAVTIFKGVGDLYWEGTSYHAVGQCLRLGGRPMEAEPFYQSALVRLAKLGDRSGVAVELDMLAVVAVELADPIRALRLAGAAAAIRDAIGAGQLLEIQAYRDPVEMLRGRIDDAQAAEAIAEGRSWSLAAAVAYANRSDPDMATDQSTMAVAGEARA